MPCTSPNVIKIGFRSAERGTECFIYYRRHILKITQPSQYRCTKLQIRFAVTSEAPSKWSASVSETARRKNRVPG